MQADVGYIILGVSDLKRSIGFYEDVLGAKLQFQHPSFHFARLTVGGLDLRLVSHPGVEIIPCRRAVGFFVPDVDEAYEAMKAKGAVFEAPPEDKPWGGRDGVFLDPDGHSFLLDARAAA